MKWKEALNIVSEMPVFPSSILMAGDINPVDLGRQLSRWVKAGNLIKLRRGLYVLSERYRKFSPHPFFMANLMKRASYISLQSALEYYGLIPEYVPSVTSVTTGRPEILSTALGNFIFKHIKKDFFYGYRLIDVGGGQTVFIARPEKALLDLLYLTPGSDDPDYLQELRLQNLETLNIEILMELAERTKSRKLWRATRKISAMLRDVQGK